MRELCTTLLNCYLIQLLETGFLHADPHPGNLIRTPQGQICILDFGLMTEVSILHLMRLKCYVIMCAIPDAHVHPDLGSQMLLSSLLSSAALRLCSIDQGCMLSGTCPELHKVQGCIEAQAYAFCHTMAPSQVPIHQAKTEHKHELVEHKHG